MNKTLYSVSVSLVAVALLLMAGAMSLLSAFGVGIRDFGHFNKAEMGNLLH